MSQLDIRRGGYLQVLDSVAVREREDVTSREIAEVTKGAFVKVLDVGVASGKAGPRVHVRVLGPGAQASNQEGWISSTTKSGRPLVDVRSAFDLKAAGVVDEPPRETAAAPPSLQRLLHNLDRAEEGEQRANMTSKQKQAEAEEAWSSFAALARDKAPLPKAAAAEAPVPASDPRVARTAAAASAAAVLGKAAQPPQQDKKEVFIPKFMLVEQPDPEYTAEVHERRLRLMQQEKARRQARNRARGRPVKEDEEPFPFPAAPAYPSRMQPAEPPQSPWERRSREEAAQHELAEKAAEAAFASRAARLVREQAGSVGQRRVPEPEKVAARSMPTANNHDFTGVWVDIGGNTHVLSQRGSIVTVKHGPGDPSSTGCGLAMRNELTMFGNIGTLSDNVLRWSDGSVWTRDAQEVFGKVSSSAGAAPVKEMASQRFDQRLPPDLADLVSPGPDIPSTESDDLPFAPGRRRPEMTMSERETYLRQEKTGQSKGEQRLWFAPWVGENNT
eukprot:TRINITY_DN93321_c0_g1_i1.p1 TRINITY_DN93321_c0_g1~~TRINITY_DN93321_c0_g1_i1.p1  ORF type:complete len:502 (-),score=106.50 TRINITY_DN93321_c0_g1_i1:132-1637(-)